MYMKKLLLFIAASALLIGTASAQTGSQDALQKNAAFTGARATQKMYHAIYQLDTNDPATIGKTIRNIHNALKDPRLAGKIQIELIAYAGGTDAYLKTGKYGDDLKSLVEKGVIVAQCHNTLVERKISRDEIFDFIAVVPSGNGELILRQAEGWAIVKP
jgi:intracellular sulfur oxidation DsrE/DsrF family protein